MLSKSGLAGDETTVAGRANGRRFEEAEALGMARRPRRRRYAAARSLFLPGA